MNVFPKLEEEDQSMKHRLNVIHFNNYFDSDAVRGQVILDKLSHCTEALRYLVENEKFTAAA